MVVLGNELCKFSSGLSIGRLRWVGSQGFGEAQKGPVKLGLTRFSVYKFRSSSAKGAVDLRSGPKMSFHWQLLQQVVADDICKQCTAFFNQHTKKLSTGGCTSGVEASQIEHQYLRKVEKMMDAEQVFKVIFVYHRCINCIL
ncbi:UNVERIFIED_CONTAM: hypothetical protein NCL1_33538 [Trichonephila clavipes]